MTGSADQLFDILSHPDFLGMKGLANEVPIFIKTYEPAEEERVEHFICALTSRLQNAGVSLAVADLFDLVLDLLDAEGRLERAIEKEPSMSKTKLREMLNNVADPKAKLIPRLAEMIGAPDMQLTLIKGVGHVHPFLRTHTILESLQPVMMAHPVVMFFPGEYTFEEGLGSRLRLFSCLPDKHYYRAFNLDHYRI
ncbi:MAG: DUF1788 domain-containing protein [Chthoniobacteraceae bacterium]